jgi:methyl-accepting chemotaxis protein
MKSFKDWQVFSKIVFLVILALIPITLFVFFYFLPSVEDSLYNEKRIQTKNLVESTIGIFDAWKQKALNNECTMETAQKQALLELSKLRYDKSNYFWVNDFNARMLMHPIKPETNGTDASGWKDPTGKYFMSEFAQVAKEKGAGFVDYMWPKPGFSEPVQKISYVKAFPEWNMVLGTGIYVDDVGVQLSSFKQKIFAGLFVAILLACILSYYFAKRIVSPIRDLQNAARRVAQGDADFIINIKTKDEFGKLEEAFSEMLHNIKEQTYIANKIAAGELDVEVKIKSDKDILSKSLLSVVNTLKNLINELKSLTDSALDGKLKTRGNQDKFLGSFKEIVEGVNKTLDAVIIPMQEGSGVLSVMATGDFTAKVTGDYKGDHQLLKASINQLGEALSLVISDVAGAILAASSASTEISASTEQMATGSQEQSSQISEISAAVQEMTKTICVTSNNASTANQTAQQAGKAAEEGGKVVAETVAGMTKIAEVVTLASNTVRELGNSSDQIGEIIQVIDDIADQTNLLALNAAIEAARAGEQGRGFAVVADEVRKLAERTTKATKEIAIMIKKIQADTSNAVESMNKGTLEVQKGTEMAHKAGASLDEIIKSTGHVVDVVTQVAVAGEEQSAAAEEISKNIEGITVVIQETSEGIQHIAEASEDLSRMTGNLENMISRFKVDASKHASQKKRALPK